jgi:hypothetical protein
MGLNPWKSRTRIAVGVLALIGVIADRAAACECVRVNICQLVESSGVIFLGEVTQGGLDPGEDTWSGRPRSATLRVVESYRGLPQGTKEVVVGLSYMKGMCSPAVYRRGEQTLVILSRQADGTLRDGSCSGSRFAKDVPDDLKYVRDYFAGRAQTTIYGRVAANRPSDLVSFVLDNSDGYPVEGAQVIAEGIAGRHAAVTDKSGAFKIVGLAAGTYQVHAEKAGFANTDEKYKEDPNFEVQLSGGGCAIQNLALWAENLVERSVRDVSGKPVIDVSVFLQEVGSKERWGEQAETDEKGNYRFKQINPGRYHLVVSPHGAAADSPFERTYYGGASDPEQAQPIEIVATSQLHSMDLRLGRAALTRDILIRLEWPDGRPVEDSLVGCKEANPVDRDTNLPEHVIRRPDGVSVCRALADRAYTVHASILYVGELKDTPPIVVSPGAKETEVRIQLGPLDAAMIAAKRQAKR